MQAATSPGTADELGAKEELESEAVLDASDEEENLHVEEREAEDDEDEDADEGQDDHTEGPKLPLAATPSGESRTKTDGRISLARRLHREAEDFLLEFHGVKESRAMGRKTRQRAPDFALKHKLCTRIVNMEDLIGLLQERIANTDPSTYLLEMSIHRIQNAYHNKWPLLSVAEQRLAIRRKAGEPENDVYQLALEAVLDTIQNARKAFQDHTDSGRALLKRIEKLRQNMRHTLEVLQSELDHDRKCLRATEGHQRMQETMVQHGTHQRLDELNVTAGNWIETVQDLIRRGHEAEDACQKYQEGTEELIDSFATECEEVDAKAMKCLEAYLEEMLQLKRQLEEEISESHHVVFKVEDALARTRRKLDRLGVPLDKMEFLAEKVHEGTRGTVVDVMDATFERLQSSEVDLEEKCQLCKRLLLQLQAAQDALVEDYNNKVMAIRAADQCRRVTPQRDETEVTRRLLVKEPKSPKKESRRPQFKELKQSQIDEVQERLRRAALNGTGGRMDVEGLFKRMDKAGTGSLLPEDLKQALRSTLRIPKEVITDMQIHALCRYLDKHNTGGVEVLELIEFINAAPSHRSCFTSFKARKAAERPHAETLTARQKRQQEEIFVRPPEHELPRLKTSVINTLRRRVQAQASVSGENLVTLFQRFDVDDSGMLEDHEVRKALRENLRIPKSVITDLEIFSLCHLLDLDKSGGIKVEELVAWVNEDDHWAAHRGHLGFQRHHHHHHHRGGASPGRDHLHHLQMTRGGGPGRAGSLEAGSGTASGSVGSVGAAAEVAALAARTSR